MHPRSLYVEQILPSLAKFLDGYGKTGTGVDTAAGAALAEQMLGLPDYIFRERDLPQDLAHYRNARDYRENHAWKAEPLYEFACDIANAWKHRNISRPGRRITGVADIVESFAQCRYRDSEGVYYRQIKYVAIRLATGGEIDLRRVIVRSCMFWSEELVRIGIVPPTPERHFVFTEHVGRADTPPLLVLGSSGEQVPSVRVAPRRFDFDYTLSRLVDASSEEGFPNTLEFQLVVGKSPFGDA